jgi:hypothetical protein
MLLLTSILPLPTPPNNSLRLLFKETDLCGLPDLGFVLRSLFIRVSLDETRDLRIPMINSLIVFFHFILTLFARCFREFIVGIKF